MSHLFYNRKMQTNFNSNSERDDVISFFFLFLSFLVDLLFVIRTAATLLFHFLSFLLLFVFFVSLPLFSGFVRDWSLNVFTLIASVLGKRSSSVFFSQCCV